MQEYVNELSPHQTYVQTSVQNTIYIHHTTTSKTPPLTLRFPPTTTKKKETLTRCLFFLYTPTRCEPLFLVSEKANNPCPSIINIYHYQLHLHYRRFNLFILPTAVTSFLPSFLATATGFSLLPPWQQPRSPPPTPTILYPPSL